MPQRAERVAVARKVVAAGRFTLQRLAASGQDFLQWCVDYWDVVAAEIAAELGISRGRASSMMDYGQTLIERLPTLGEVFTAGAVDFRVIRIVAFRTALIRDEQALAAIDEMVAHKAPAWNALSDKKLADLLDWMVLDVDPDAWRVTQQADEDRHLEFGRAKDGTVEVYGSLRITDAAALNARLAGLAATVCRDDPRTTRQRRADAITAVLAGESTMACQCGSEHCQAATNADVPSNVVIHVVAEEATATGEGALEPHASGRGEHGFEAVQRIPDITLERTCDQHADRAEQRGPAEVHVERDRRPVDQRFDLADQFDLHAADTDAVERHRLRRFVVHDGPLDPVGHALDFHDRLDDRALLQGFGQLAPPDAVDAEPLLVARQIGRALPRLLRRQRDVDGDGEFGHTY